MCWECHGARCDQYKPELSGLTFLRMYVSNVPIHFVHQREILLGLFVHYHCKNLLVSRLRCFQMDANLYGSLYAINPICLHYPFHQEGWYYHATSFEEKHGKKILGLCCLHIVDLHRHEKKIL